MFIAFALTTGVGIFSSIIVRTGNVPAIRTAVRASIPLHSAGGALILVGVIFGFATATSAGFSLTSHWLIAAYVLAALILIIGFGVHRPWVLRVVAAAAASPDDRMSPELAASVGERPAQLAGPISGLLWIAVIAIMVLRPS